MKRLFLSVFLGFLTVGLLFVPSIWFVGHASEQSIDTLVDNPVSRVCLELLFWPEFLVSALVHLDCPNANEIADKLTCAGGAYAIDVLTYSALWFVLLRFVKKQKGARTSAAKSG